MSSQQDPLIKTEPVEESLEDENQDEDGNMVNMFASVWVKVEVADNESERLAETTCKQNEKESVKAVPKPNKRKKKNKPTKQLYCDHCSYTTVYKNCLALHVLGHSNIKPRVCTMCNYETKYPSSLQRHIAVQHRKDENEPVVENGKVLQLHKCSQCDYTTYYKWNLNAHKRKHNEKEFKCSHCPFATAYRHNYVKHSKVHDEGTVFKCDKCPFVTKYDGHITRHLAKVHNEVTEEAHKCDFCDFSTKVRWRLNIHKQRMRKDYPLNCQFCKFQTIYTCELKSHRVTHYNDICIDRPMEQAETNEEDKNTSQDTPDNFTYDNDYDSKTEKKYELDPNCLDWNSIQVLEFDGKEKPYGCHMCSYVSKFKAAVQRHFQRHHTGNHNRPYKCIHCDFSTKTKDQIALHIKRSKTEIRMTCHVCKFGTYHKCQFVLHQKTHYEFKCNECSYSCKHKHELHRHFTLYHLGTGLKCRYCNYRAMRKDCLLSHEMIHTGTKPFRCKLCDYSSVRKYLLINHLKKFHSSKNDEQIIVSNDRIESLKAPMIDEEYKLFQAFENQNCN